MRQIRFLAGLFLLSLTGCSEDDTQRTTTSSDNKPGIMTPSLPYTLVNQYPHNEKAFTEGLEFTGGYMYESTGQKGTSYIAKYKLGNTEAEKKYTLDDKYFGEGMTIFGDKIYMLSYQERTGFVIDRNSFQLLNTFPLPTKEGWGMTHDSTHLIYGDGSANLYYLNPETFTIEKTIEIRDGYGPVMNINELEYINGYIYANQWNTNYILKIDPSQKKVVAQADLSNLRRQAGLQPTPFEDVLNGIAYDEESNRIFVTGKYWPRIFEIKLDN